MKKRKKKEVSVMTLDELRVAIGEVKKRIKKMRA